jgi:nuclear transport factor 2 (NTF2) superfamily protein
MENRSRFVKGRDAIREFLSDKWVREQDYRLIEEIWAHSDNRIAVRFCYEYQNAEGKWFRACGEYKTFTAFWSIMDLVLSSHFCSCFFLRNKNWEFDSNGLMINQRCSH